MGPDELEVSSAGLLLKIHYITGWVLPVADEHMNVLEDQFRKKLTEAYASVNAEEVEYAFRNYGTLVKDWGKQMNLSLIDEVMIPYLSTRSELSKMEEQIKKPMELPVSKESTSDASMTEWLEDIKKNPPNSIYFYPVMLYDWLEKIGEINLPNEEKKVIMEQAIQYRLSELIQAAQKGGKDEAERLGKFTQMKLDGFDKETKDFLKRLSKQIALKKHIEK